MSRSRLKTVLALALAAMSWVAPATAQTSYTVELIGIEFVPADIAINLGNTVHWVWVTGVHDVKSGPIVGQVGVYDENFDSGDPGVGLTFDVVFDQAFLDAKPMPGNVYPYFCRPHEAVGMEGTITVTSGAGGCTSDAECDAGDPCATYTCNAGACMVTPVPGCSSCSTNSDCDDGDACTDDACVSGVSTNASIVGCGEVVGGDDPAGNTGGDGTTAETTQISGTCGAMGMLPLLSAFLGLGFTRASSRRRAGRPR